MSDASEPVSPGLFGWWRDGTPEGRRALVAAGLGWMLDAFDVMLYALVLNELMAQLALSKPVAGLLGSITLLASAVGGVVFGVIADRAGRTRALMLSILVYSVFTFLCGLAQDVWQLAAFRVGLGLGMGGEWASGAALVAETWRARDRGKALGLMQSAWAIGYGLAAIVVALVLPRWGWRAVFFAGVLPALFTLWVRRHVREPALWQAAQRQTTQRQAQGARRGRGLDLGAIVGAGRLGVTVAVTLMNACTMFAWWGFNLWLPGYLSLPVAAGGVGLSTTAMSGFVVAMQVGMWLGYVTFGYASDLVGRRRAYVTYLIAAAILILIYVSVRAPLPLLLLGPLVAFFATGYFSGFGAVTAELYPTAIRATAQGLTYNIGRVASAGAPFLVGTLAQTHGFGLALSICSAAFLLAAVFWIWIPETRGRTLASIALIVAAVGATAQPAGAAQPRADVAAPGVFTTTVEPRPGENVAAACGFELTLMDPSRTLRGVWVIYERSRDTRRYYDDAEVRAFARRRDLALLYPSHCAAASSPAPGDIDVEPAHGLGRVLFAALSRLAETSGHAELASAKLVLLGFSGTGSLVARLAAFAPSRVAAVLATHPGHFDPLGMDTIDMPAAARDIPQLILAGSADAVSGTARPYAYFRRHHDRGAPWTFVVQNQVPHCCIVNAKPLVLAWLDAVLTRPAPRSRDRSGFVTVTPTQSSDCPGQETPPRRSWCRSPTDAWAGENWSVASAVVGRRRDVRPGMLPAGWLPTPAFATEWRAFVTTPEHPVSLPP